VSARSKPQNSLVLGEGDDSLTAKKGKRRRRYNRAVEEKPRAERGGSVIQGGMERTDGETLLQGGTDESSHSEGSQRENRLGTY